MGRELSKPTVVNYVPVAYGIREEFLKGEDPSPVVLVLKPLSSIQLRRYRDQLQARVGLKKGKDGETVEQELFIPNSQALIAKMVEENCVEIRNLTCEGEPVTNGKELLQTPADHLVEEVALVLQDISALSGGELGKLTSQSGGKSPEIPPSDGTAEPVKPSGGTEAGTAPGSTDRIAS